MTTKASKRANFLTIGAWRVLIAAAASHPDTLSPQDAWTYKLSPRTVAGICAQLTERGLIHLHASGDVTATASGIAFLSEHLASHVERHPQSADGGWLAVYYAKLELRRHGREPTPTDDN
jgi:hypothetical protein